MEKHRRKLITKLPYRSSHTQMFLGINALTNFTIFTGKKLCWSISLIKLHAWRTVTSLEKDSSTGFFLVNIAKFLSTAFLHNTSGDCFCTLGTTVRRNNKVRRNKKERSQNKFFHNYLGSPTQTDYNSWRSEYSHVFFIHTYCRPSGRQRLLTACICMWTESHKICKA